MNVRTVVFRISALLLLLVLVLVPTMMMRSLQQLPDSLVYFVRDEGDLLALESAGRQIRASSREEWARAAIGALRAGPTSRERADGLTTAVPGNTDILDVRFRRGLLEVDLSEEFEFGGGSAEMQARLHQLFYTLTQPKAIEGVQLRIEGREAEIFSGQGIIVEQPWLRANHASLPLW